MHMYIRSYHTLHLLNQHQLTTPPLYLHTLLKGKVLVNEQRILRLTRDSLVRFMYRVSLYVCRVNYWLRDGPELHLFFTIPLILIACIHVQVHWLLSRFSLLLQHLDYLGLWYGLCCYKYANNKVLKLHIDLNPIVLETWFDSNKLWIIQKLFIV